MNKHIILAALAVASVVTTNAGEIGFGLSLANWRKTVNGNPPPVYYTPAQQAAAPAAPVATTTAPAAQQQATTVAVLQPNGTYVLVPVIPAQQPAYVIPANQVPLEKARTEWSVGPRFTLFANK